MDEGPRNDLMEYTVEIVSSYVSNNSLPASEIAQLIFETHQALTRVTERQPQLYR
jgi:predicted transcriptional regulator